MVRKKVSPFAYRSLLYDQSISYCKVVELLMVTIKVGSTFRNDLTNYLHFCDDCLKLRSYG
jgi:hypothetical protein